MNPPLLLCLNVAASLGGSVILIKKIKQAKIYVIWPGTGGCCGNLHRLGGSVIILQASLS